MSLLLQLAFVGMIILGALLVVFNKRVALETARGGRAFSRDRSDVEAIRGWQLKWNRFVTASVGLVFVGVSTYQLLS